MSKKFFRKSFPILLSGFFIAFVISCEEDFTDIRTTIVGNNDFTTNDTVLSITAATTDIENVRADAVTVGGVLGQYLLGVYNNENYEKIEASIITQLGIPANLAFDDAPLGQDNDTISSVYTIDTAYIKLPYQATSLGDSGAGLLFRLDSIINTDPENPLVPTLINVFRLSSFLNVLDPADPTQQNLFLSDQQYDIFSEKIHVSNRDSSDDYFLINNSQNTAQFVNRRNLNDQIYQTDTITLTSSNPFIAIPIKKSIIQQEFIDKYTSTSPEFQSQDAFNNFFRGLFIKASGDEGSLISFNFNTLDPLLTPSLEIFYTRTATITGNVVRNDSIVPLNDSFQFNGIRNSQYKMTDGNPLATNQAKVQGTAGSYINLDILGEDANQNGFPDQLDFLRTKNWLINDARITVYIDKTTIDRDTVVPPRLYLFKDGVLNGQPNQSQVLDIFPLPVSEGFIDGFLRLDDNNLPDRYIFRITDYISELASGNLNYLPSLGVKAYNPTDLPTTELDTIVRTFNWNPRAVILLNHLDINGDRKPELRISYSEKIEDTN